MKLFAPPALRVSLACAALVCTPCISFSQTAPVAASKAPSAALQDAANSKKWSVYWGWNRSNYSASDIHFTGTDHDFTLRGVAANDIQTDVSQHLFDTYLNPSEITIPQTNLRIAYQYNADTAIAVNLDHMKYVVAQDQSVPISGQILGVAQSGQQVLANNWLNFEHTDGLNIVTLELEKQRPVDWFGENHAAKVFALAGVGLVLPKTNATMHMINQVRNDQFHFAGYSVGMGAGLDVDVYKDVFFRTAYKTGYVDLPDVLTSARGDKASHHFTYNELLIALGIRF
ncbi:MAG: hypothetical protein RIR45_2116 [Pseudomonadota bacterium]